MEGETNQTEAEEEPPDTHEHERLCAHVLTVERVLKAYIPANAAPFPGS